MSDIQNETQSTVEPASEPTTKRAQSTRKRGGDGQNRSAIWALIGVVVGFGLPILGCVGTFALIGSLGSLGGGLSTASLDTATVEVIQGPSTGPAVGVIDVVGPIVSEGGGAFATGSFAVARDIIDAIETTTADSDVQAILLRVNTPGGSVVASDEIHHALEKVEQPVVVYMGETAASGGYYISAGAEHIIANPNTFTGSIGVIIQTPNVADLAERFGYDQIVFKSGENKDLLNPYRPVSEEERTILQDIVDSVYEDFLEVVLTGRENLSEEELRPLADGRIFTGDQAFEVGLVDSVGYEEDAITLAAELGDIDVAEGEAPRVIRYGSGSGFEDLFGSLPGVRALNQLDALTEGEFSATPSLEYRWLP